MTRSKRRFRNAADSRRVADVQWCLHWSDQSHQPDRASGRFSKVRTEPVASAIRLISQRAGATLSEVLISLLVMSIGVVSLATLFPIAILRSVQATHLTNSANLRYNVEALLSVRAELYSIGRPWVAGATYSIGDLVTPTELTSLKSPPCVFQCINGGIAGTQEPAWSFIDSDTKQEVSGLTWQTFRLQNYVIDPLGKWNVESSFRSTANNGDFFGNSGGAPRAIQLPSGAWNIRAFPGLGANNQLLAAEAATLPDSWVSQAESNAVTNVAGTSCDLIDMQVDLSQTLPFDPSGLFPQSRIVLFDATGKNSEVRPITATYTFPPAPPVGPPPLVGTSGQRIVWPASSGTLNITPVRARVESKEQRYSWLLSVRRGFSGASFMDVVVFFRRPFSAKDEQVYPAKFTAIIDPGFDGLPGIAGVDDDGDGNVDFIGGNADTKELGWPGSDDAPRNWVVVQYDDSAGDKPYLRKGGFVTDADGLRWYRIIDIVEGDLLNGYTPDAVMKKSGLKTTTSTPAGILVADAIAPGTTKAVLLRIENKILQSTPVALPQGGAILMRGIVDVYPIRTHLSWEN